MSVRIESFSLQNESDRSSSHSSHQLSYRGKQNLSFSYRRGSIARIQRLCNESVRMSRLWNGERFVLDFNIVYREGTTRTATYWK